MKFFCSTAAPVRPCFVPTLFGILLLVLLTCCRSAKEGGVLPAFANGDHLLVCGDDKVLVIDPEASTNEQAAVLWQWTQADTDVQPLAEGLAACFRTIDDCRAVSDGRELLLTSSGGGAMLVDVAERKALWSARVPMAHAAELLPGGKIAVALSTDARGNALHLYDRAQGDRLLDSDTLYSAHGVVWMPRQKRLYALGYKELRCYRVLDLDTPHPRLDLECLFPLPDVDGHELSRVDDHTLFLSTAHYSFLFSLRDNQLTAAPMLGYQQKVKSAIMNASFSRIAYTVATRNWWTHTVETYGPRRSIPLPEMKVYKVRRVGK